MKNNNENIIFYRAWYDALVSKSPDFRHQVLDAVLAFAFEKKIPDFPKESGLQIAYENITSIIAANRSKYAAKQEKRREAAEARWKDLNAKNANAFNAMQNENLHSPARKIKDKDKDNEKDKDKDKDKDNGSKEIDTLSLSQKNKNISSAEVDGERERVVFEYALFLLAEGRVSAYDNAVRAWEYNAALDWNRETERKDGSVVRQPIRYKLNWLKNREQKPSQEFDSEHGALLAAILRRTGMLPENAAIINNFRGCAIRGDCLYFLYSVISPAVRAMAQAFDKNPKINTIVSQEIAHIYPDIQSFSVIKKSDF